MSTPICVRVRTYRRIFATRKSRLLRRGANSVAGATRFTVTLPDERLRPSGCGPTFAMALVTVCSSRRDRTRDAGSGPADLEAHPRDRIRREPADRREVRLDDAAVRVRDRRRVAVGRPRDRVVRAATGPAPSSGKAARTAHASWSR